MDKDIAIRIARMFFSSLVFRVSSQGRGLVLPSTWSARYVALVIFKFMWDNGTALNRMLYAEYSSSCGFGR